MDVNEALKLDNQLCFALYAGSREMNSIYKPYLDEIGLTYTQYITMLVLWEKPVINFKELGEKLRLDSGTLTPLVKKLEASGILERKRDKEDERTVIISLTDQGRAMKSKAEEIPFKVFKNTGLSMEELVKMKDILKDLICRIQENKECLR